MAWCNSIHSLIINTHPSNTKSLPKNFKNTHTEQAILFFALFVYRPKDSIRIFIVVFENFLSLKHSSIFSGWICLIFDSVQCNAMKMRYFPHCLCSDWMGQSKGKMDAFYRFLFCLDPRLDKFPNSLRDLRRALRDFILQHHYGDDPIPSTHSLPPLSKNLFTIFA